MLVLLDLEWDEVVKLKRNATQISAIRVDDDWTIVDHFSSVIAPYRKNKTLHWLMGAYNGYQQEDFWNGEKERDCYFRFKAWLKEDDLICCDGDQTEKTLLFLHNRHDKKAPYINRCIYAKPILVQKSSVENANQCSIYQLAEKEGICIPKPEHCAENDVKALYELFVKLNISVWQLYRAQKSTKENIPIRLRNRAEIEILAYQYVFTKDSRVYHNNNCKLILSTKKLCGCIKLKTAAANRRPCRKCMPEAYAEWERAEAERLLKERAEAEFPHMWKNLHPREEMAYVPLINGEISYTYWKYIVGYCNYSGHPGMVNMEVVKGHECFQKKCLHLTVNPLSDYWLSRGGKRKKNKQKEEQFRLENEMSKAKAENEELLKAEFQRISDQTESKLLIVRVTIESRKAVRINYVSDNSYADGNLFPAFTETIKENHPYLRLNMKHVRDIRGSFMTTDEFLNRKK